MTLTPEKSRKLVSLIVVATLVIIVATWWINGAEIEDAWLYFVAIAVVISGIQATRPSKK